jgi:cell division protein FtsI/penicillin-binding protein 2
MGIQTKAIYVAAILGVFSCINKRAESEVDQRADYESLVAPIIDKSIKELNADSIAVYIYSGANKKQWFTMYWENGGRLNNSDIPLDVAFEPSSLIKPYWASILVENDLVKLDDSIPYESKFKIYDMFILDSINMELSYVTLEKAIMFSSNTTIARFLLANSGQTCIENELQKMIDPVVMSGITLPWAAMGYGVSMPITDIMEFYFQVANKLESPKFSETTLGKIDSLLSEVVKNGTASNLYSEALPINGKTGTVQKHQSMPNEGRFIGYSAKDPSVVVMVRVFNPSPIYYGAVTAGPIVEQILKGLNK